MVTKELLISGHHSDPFFTREGRVDPVSNATSVLAWSLSHYAKGSHPETGRPKRWHSPSTGN